MPDYPAHFVAIRPEARIAHAERRSDASLPPSMPLQGIKTRNVIPESVQCPVDAVLMAESDGRYRCPVCKRGFQLGTEGLPVFDEGPDLATLGRWEFSVWASKVPLRKEKWVDNPPVPFRRAVEWRIGVMRQFRMVRFYALEMMADQNELTHRR